MRNGMGNSIFFTNCGNKKGACLYNKRLTSTLNTLPQKLVTANLEAVVHDKSLQSMGIECAIWTIGD